MYCKRVCKNKEINMNECKNTDILTRDFSMLSFFKHHLKPRQCLAQIKLEWWAF